MREVPFKRVRSDTQIMYSSAIAHPIAAQSHRPVSTVAAEIAEAIRVYCHTGQNSSVEKLQLLLPVSKAILQDVQVRWTENGLIQLELSDRAIATWLDQVIHDPAQLERLTPAQDCDQSLIQSTVQSDRLWSEIVFSTQYAHARCCSLLHLAHRENLIVLEFLDAEPSHWQWAHSSPIPWLTATDHLQINHASERRLIGQLLSVFDEPAQNSASCLSTRMLQQANLVSHAFQKFHRDRPLFSYRPGAPKEAMYAQFGLVMATQRLLNYLLRQWLNAAATSEL